MEAVTELIQSSQSKKIKFFEFSRVYPGAYPLTKKPEDSGYEIVHLLGTEHNDKSTMLFVALCDR